MTGTSRYICVKCAFLFCICPHPVFICHTALRCHTTSVMPVTFTCLLFGFGELCQVSDESTDQLSPASCLQLPPLHWLDVSCASLPGQQTALWHWAVCLKRPRAGVTVSFSETIYKPPVCSTVCHLCPLHPWVSPSVPSAPPHLSAICLLRPPSVYDVTAVSDTGCSEVCVKQSCRQSWMFGMRLIVIVVTLLFITHFRFYYAIKTMGEII